MDKKCRICLEHKKNIRSIFESPSENACSFAQMITSLTNIKVGKSDGLPDIICLRCRKRLKEAYDFKLEIERSNVALQDTASLKRIYFDDLDDIKMKLDVKVLKQENSVDEYFIDGEKSINFNDTTIKKVEPYEIQIQNEEGPLPVLDFLNTIKDDGENGFDDDYDVDYEPVSDAQEDEFLLPLNKRLKQKTKKKKKNRETIKIKTTKIIKNSKMIAVSIKPVYLEDIKVLPTRECYDDQPKIKKKKIYRLPKDMCNICGKMTTNIKHHVLTHTGDRSFKCKECGKGFLTDKSLAHHEKSVHASERNFKCDLCVAAFTNKATLKSHMARHTDVKKFVCDICNKGFKRKCTLRRHQINHNVANKSIKCDLCNMSFFTKFGLNHHLRIHTGERPYNCEICSQPYSYKHDFNRHCFKKHGVFLKRRSVHVMNEEVLRKERALMRDLMLKIHGFGREGEPLNPFDGPQGYLAFEQAVKALQEKQIPIDYNM